MKTYAHMKNDKVFNVFVTDSQEIADDLVGANDTAIEVTDLTNNAYIGGDMIDGKFRPLIPEPSDRYTWNAESFSWQYVFTEEELTLPN
jgi:hypothetical protein